MKFGLIQASRSADPGVDGGEFSGERSSRVRDAGVGTVLYCQSPYGFKYTVLPCLLRVP